MLKKIFFFIIAIFCLMITISANLWKNSLRIEKIVVEGNSVIENGEVIRLAGIKLNAELTNVNLHNVRQRILQNTFIKEVVVSRELPETIHILIEERVPIAIVDANRNLYIDCEGVIISHPHSSKLMDLPLLSGINCDVEIKPKMVISSPQINQAIEILMAARDLSNNLDHMLSEIQLHEGGDIVLYSSEFGVPIIFGMGNTIDKLVKLEILWKDVVREKGAQELQYIDLRYDNQVIVRWNKENI